MAKRLALTTLVVSMLAVMAAYGSAFLPGGTPRWAPWAMALAIPATLVAMMVLGAARAGRVGKLWLPFAFVFVVVAGGFCVVLSLPPVDPGDPTLWLGLPPRTAIVMYGIGLLPLIAMPIGYALTFDEMTLSDDDLSRVRAAAAPAARAARGAE